MLIKILLLIAFLSCFLMIIVLFLKRIELRGMHKDLLLIEEGSYKILAKYGLHILLDEVDSCGKSNDIVRYYFVNTSEYHHGIPENLTIMMTEIEKIPVGMIIEIYKNWAGFKELRTMRMDSLPQ